VTEVETTIGEDEGRAGNASAGPSFRLWLLGLILALLPLIAAAARVVYLLVRHHFGETLRLCTTYKRPVLGAVDILGYRFRTGGSASVNMNINEETRIRPRRTPSTHIEPSCKNIKPPRWRFDA